MTRKPTTQPATAYQYRRHIVLVQAIATGKWTALNALMTAWNVPVERAWCNMDGRPTFEGMCHMLARFVVRQHVEETTE